MAEEKSQGNTQMPDPREIQKIRLDPDIGANRKLKTVGGTTYFYGPGTSIFTKSSFAAMAHFAAGDTAMWAFGHDEWQYILKGEADVTYSLDSTLHTEQKTMHISQGDLYFIPAGARLTWKVAPHSELVRLNLVLIVSAPQEPLPSYIAPGAMGELK